MSHDKMLLDSWSILQHVREYLEPYAIFNTAKTLGTRFLRDLEVYKGNARFVNRYVNLCG